MKKLTFTQPHHSNVHAVKAGAGSVWAGFCHRPSLLLKISQYLQEIVPITFSDEGGLHELAFDGRNLWGAHASGHLSRINPVTNEFHSHVMRLSSNKPPFLYCLINRDGYLWTGTYTDPGRLLRIDPAHGGCEEIVLPQTPHYSIRALVATPDAVWALLYTVPGRVIIVDKQSLGWQALALGEDNVLCTSGACCRWIPCGLCFGSSKT